MKQIDFTPQWYHIELRSVRNRRKRLAFLVILSALMICWFVINEGRIQQAHAVLRLSQATSDQSQLLSARLQDLTHEKHTLLRQHQHSQSLLNNFPPSVIFAELSHLIPPDASLLDFKLEPIESRWTSRSASKPRARTTRPGRTRSAKGGPAEPAPGGHQSRLENAGMVVTLTAHALSSDVMYRFVQNLKNSPLFVELHQGGIESREMFGTTVKQKTIQLYVLSAECIGP